jgi:hypothetical protein
MPCDVDPSEEEAFYRLVKRVLTEESERFPAPGARVWRALSARLGCQVNVGIGGNEATSSLAEDVQSNSGGDAHDGGPYATPHHWEC